MTNVSETAGASSTTMYRSMSDHSSIRLNAAAPASQNAWTNRRGWSSAVKARMIEARDNVVFLVISKSPKSATLLYITSLPSSKSIDRRVFVPSASAESDRQQLMQAAHGFRISQALYVVAKLGIVDLLEDGPRTSDELAKRADAHPRALLRVLRVLASLGYFTQDASNRFGLTPKTRPLLSDDPDSVRPMIIFLGEGQYQATGELLHSVRTGETSFDHLHGMGHFEFLAQNPEASAVFNAAMASGLRQTENPFDRYDFSGRHLVVDVGGGRGDQIVSILRANPMMKGILFDLPQVAPDARAYLKASGVASRCELKTGSAFESIPPGGDVYVMSRVLHDWPDDKAALLLTNCRKAISNDGILLIRDSVLPEGAVASQAKQMDLTMLIMTGGLERSEDEWRALLRASGFRLANVRRTTSPFDLIEAKPI
ncbi:MAG: hypothetical protein E6K17_08585 [Methanobacteriota archaeon]|nr:MAG: hypothetical protein E6K17_08585 [Euryarchaeota archaeon]